jgi:DNA-binding transcriptional LysR family regulator
MDTRQLQAFCEVVERKSFSQAAERLGVTQPAVSLQVQALEKRVGTKLLDRSGRRVEPTEAGTKLYRSAQRLLALEEEILHELAEGQTGALSGTLEIGASTGPGGVLLPRLLCEFAQEHPGLNVALTVSDTQRIVERVGERSLQLGVVGAAPRHRGVVYEPFFRDSLVLVCPPGHRFAGRRVSVDDLRDETVIQMQEGAGIREVVEEELRTLGVRPADLNVRLELGLQESVVSAVRAGFGVAFISQTAVVDEIADGRLAEARVVGLDAEREIWVVRSAGRSEPRVAREFIEFAKARLV